MAITEEKLAETRNTLEELSCEVQELIRLVNSVYNPNIVEITLTVEQKKTLMTAYDNKKGNLVVLYNKLP